MTINLYTDNNPNHFNIELERNKKFKIIKEFIDDKKQNIWAENNQFLKETEQLIEKSNFLKSDDINVIEESTHNLLNEINILYFANVWLNDSNNIPESVSHFLKLGLIDRAIEVNKHHFHVTATITILHHFIKNNLEFTEDIYHMFHSLPSDVRKIFILTNKNILNSDLFISLTKYLFSSIDRDFYYKLAINKLLAEEKPDFRKIFNVLKLLKINFVKEDCLINVLDHLIKNKFLNVELTTDILNLFDKNQRDSRIGEFCHKLAKSNIYNISFLNEIFKLIENREYKNTTEHLIISRIENKIY